MTAAEKRAKDVISRVLTEDVLSIAQTRIEIEKTTGQKPQPSTVIRWMQIGCGGIRLDAVRVGSQWVTSRQAIHRFILARTAAN